MTDNKSRLAALKNKASALTAIAEPVVAVKMKKVAPTKKALKKLADKSSGKGKPPVKTKKGITIKDREFADYYVGGPDHLRGNATACYKQIHPKAKQTSCQVEGSKTLLKPMVQQYLAEKSAQLQEKTGINAEYVLRQAVRFLEMSMGDISVSKSIMIDGKLRTVDVKEFNPSGAGKALELIGKHIAVRAFQESFTVDHTHNLEQLLNERGKAVEAAAARRKLELVHTERPDDS